MVAEKYAVRLSSEDRDQLERLIRSGAAHGCSAPNGGTPKRGWRGCCTTIPKPTGIASWTIGAKPT